LAPFAVQRGNGIDQRQGFVRVVPIRAGETYGERHASPVPNQMTLAPALGPIGRVRTSLVAAEDEQNAGETRAIGDARPSTFPPTWWSWQERFDQIPQRIGKQRRSHTRPRFVADEDQVSAVLLHALTF